MSLPPGLRYTTNHEWVSDPEGPTARVGITDYAANALGDVVFLDLPEVGDQVSAGSPCGEVESTKSVESLYAPVSGAVLAINEDVINAPELVNQEPFGAGWMYEVAPEGQPGELLDAAAYQELVTGLAQEHD